MKRLIISNPEQTGELDPEALYKKKVEYRKLDIERRLKGPKSYTEQDIKKVMSHEADVFKWNKEDLKRADKLNKDTAILVAAHASTRVWLKACLEACKKTGYFVVLTYDNPFHKVKENARAFPVPNVMSLADSVIIKHKTFLHSVAVCHYWNMIYGLSIIKGLGFKNTFALNGDCVMEKPENFQQILGMLGDGDLLPCQYEPSRRYVGTMGWLGKTDMMLDFFHTHRKTLHMYSRTTEGHLWFYALENNLKIVVPENPPEYYRVVSPGTWYNVLGFRHIHAEHKVHRIRKLPPPDKKFYDLEPKEYYSRGEWALLQKYWETKDEEHLKQWWGIN